MKFALWIGAFLSGVMLEGSAYSVPAQRVWQDVSYVEDGMTGHLLDVYLPEEGDGPWPVIVSIAGSAWFSDNTKQRAYEIAKPLREAGFAIVAVNHRSSRQAIFPAQLNDIKAVVRYVRGNADRFSLDTRFIGITGDSSGGHLSSLMGTSVGVGTIEQAGIALSLEGNLGGFLGESSSVDAVVDWYGPSDFQAMDGCGSTMSHDSPMSPESTLVGGPIQEMDTMCDLANPISYVDSGDVPFLIFHGDEDPLVPHCQSELLHEALTDSGVSSRLVIVPGGGHGKGMWIPEYTGQMVEFFAAQRDAVLNR